MKELVIIVIVAVVSHPVAGVINAERWAVQEMAARFEKAKRDGERIESEMQLLDGWDMFADQSGSFKD